jgi:hypothetical protein
VSRGSGRVPAWVAARSNSMRAEVSRIMPKGWSERRRGD